MTALTIDNTKQELERQEALAKWNRTSPSSNGKLRWWSFNPPESRQTWKRLQGMIPGGTTQVSRVSPWQPPRCHTGHLCRKVDCSQLDRAGQGLGKYKDITVLMNTENTISELQHTQITLKLALIEIKHFILEKRPIEICWTEWKWFQLKEV